jgi:putative ABC transport system ATP-binding protein
MPDMASEALFHVHNISKIYHMGEVDVAALRGVDFDLYPAEFLVLLGPSGSGKSTLLNILGGLDTPTGGEVFYRDHNLTAADDNELTRYRREHVGFVFQFYNLIPSLTALENVSLVTEISENPIDAKEALEMVDLTARMHHFPAQLSGGEQQRVAAGRSAVR